MTKIRTAAALALAGALAVGTVSSSVAAPAPVGTSTVKAAADAPVTNVRYYGHHWRGGGWFPGAVIGGLALGALGAATYPYWYDGYYGAPYAYDYGYYGGYPYGYAYAPGYAYGGWRHHYWR